MVNSGKRLCSLFILNWKIITIPYLPIYFLNIIISSVEFKYDEIKKII